MSNSNHPCYNNAAHGQFGRIHLPVAPQCNIACAYCNRKTDCVNESRPGVCSTVLEPEEAASLVATARKRMPSLSVVGIAGPGDPLATPDLTLRTFELVRQQHPDLMLCLSTNGLVLADYAKELQGLGVNHITITLNASSPTIGKDIYRHVISNGEAIYGFEAAETLLHQQIKAVTILQRLGITVKANTVVMPGINDKHVIDIAKFIAQYEVRLMNLIALIPLPETPLRNVSPPTPKLMQELRLQAGEYVTQMRHCARCRADAFGLLTDNTSIQDLFLEKSAPPKNALCSF